MFVRDGHSLIASTFTGMANPNSESSSDKKKISIAFCTTCFLLRTIELISNVCHDFLSSESKLIYRQ
jgi:hypothetical protein